MKGYCLAVCSGMRQVSKGILGSVKYQIPEAGKATMDQKNFMWEQRMCGKVEKGTRLSLGWIGGELSSKEQ